MVRHREERKKIEEDRNNYVVTDVLCIGGGSEGTNLSCFAGHTGLKVVLVEKGPSVLGGAPLLTFYLHSDGIEYHHPRHQATGKLCVEGGVVQNVLYPRSMLQGAMYDPSNPLADNMRFLLSKESAEIAEEREGAVRPESFERNAEYMRAHYQKQYRHLKESLGLTDEEMLERYGMTLQSNIVKLPPEQYAHMDNVVLGYAGEGKIVSMPTYYAYMKKALEKTGVDVRTNRTVERVEKICRRGEEGCPAEGYPADYPEEGYVATLSDGSKVVTRAIHLAAGHKNPEILNKVPGAAPCSEMRGTYYSNAMVFIKLPATNDEALRKQFATPGFVLQGPVNGCAYTPVKVPGSIDPDDPHANGGFATLYYPDDKRGNQLRAHPYDPKNPHLVPEEWDLLANGAQPVPQERIDSIMEQAEHYYPFLKGRQKYHGVGVRSVFNAATPENPGGTFRNIRDMPKTLAEVAPRVTVGATPKWTTAALVALGNVHGILQSLGREGLPVLESGEGMGPASIDLSGFVRKFGCIDIRPDEVERADMEFYARQQGFPGNIIDKSVIHKRPERVSGRREDPHYMQETISFAVKHRSIKDVVESHPKGRRFAEVVEQSESGRRGRY